MSTYLVTGAAGFIGSHLAERLLEQGHEVIGLDSFTAYYADDWKRLNVAPAREHPSFELVEADLLDDRLLDCVERTDSVFHLAAQPGVRASWGHDFDAYVRDNVLATQRVFEAASRLDRRVVYASSSSVYGDALTYPTTEETPPRPISPYGITKLGCEHLARAYAAAGLEAVGIRYFTVYGPRQRPDMAFTRIAAALLAGAPFAVFGDGSQSRDVTYVGDAVEATIAAMSANGHASLYNVGGGSETSLRTVIELFERLSGRSLDARYGPRQKGDVKRTASDTSALRDDAGWEPRVGVEEGVAAQLEWARGLNGRVLESALSSA
jgi:UDP-glucuronate 4-epimerase